MHEATVKGRTHTFEEIFVTRCGVYSIWHFEVVVSGDFSVS